MELLPARWRAARKNLMTKFELMSTLPFLREGPLRARNWLAALLLAVAGLVAVPLQADIRTTKHNLAERMGLNPATVDEREVCVFCHFPAVADLAGNVVGRTEPPNPPRWQQSVPGDHAYTLYDDIGRVGLDGAKPVGSQSVACLACHDANQAFVVSGGARDHPFGIPYRGARVSQAQRDAALEAVRLAGTPLREGIYLLDKLNTDYRPAFESVVENRMIFWVSRNGNSIRRAKTDLPLYSRRGSGVPEDVPFVECTSCHDPHTSTPLFLRVSNDQNELCLTCHVK